MALLSSLGVAGAPHVLTELEAGRRGDVARGLRVVVPMKTAMRPPSDVRMVDLGLFWLETTGRRADDLAGFVAGFVFFGVPGAALMIAACSLVNVHFGRGLPF